MTTSVKLSSLRELVLREIYMSCASAGQIPYKRTTNLNFKAIVLAMLSTLPPCLEMSVNLLIHRHCHSLDLLKPSLIASDSEQ